MHTDKYQNLDKRPGTCNTPFKSRVSSITKSYQVPSGTELENASVFAQYGVHVKSVTSQLVRRHLFILYVFHCPYVHIACSLWGSYTQQTEKLFFEEALCNSSVTSDCLTSQIKAVSVIVFVSAVTQSSVVCADSLMNPESSVICPSTVLAKCLVLVKGLFFVI